MMQRTLTRDRGMGFGEKLASVSWPFIVLLCLLAGTGYAMLYSAAGGSPEPWAFRHGLRFGFGVLLMLSIALVDIRLILKLAWPLYLLGIGLLVLVALHGAVGKGAQRWLDLGPIQVQPSELMKIFLVIALASWFHRASIERVGNPLFLIPPLIAVAVPVVMVLRQPNLGNALITCMLAGVMLFVAGVRLWKFALVGGAVAVAAPIAYESLHDYQKNRILTFLNPESDPLGTGYHIIQSKIALGSGGMFGQGFVQGTQSQLNFLPEKQTDFIFTMLAEEFGFAGAAALLGLNLLVVLNGLAMAFSCRHQFGRLVAVGITTNFFLYVFVNIAMVMGAIPVGGVPLPLVSHGGSAMITVMIGFGVLMSVHVHRDVEIEGEQQA
ncbi:rod shape-determining protein RodA [Elioraea rosea]|uniref:rod shape-determining protein RodA n=1 Tax=Elioraea rosea TaxID=2492390 RepID=UPI0011839AAA|nr:rod shape-determining protein RodA [Elioraea rosea]